MPYHTVYYLESCTKESDTTFQVLLEKDLPSPPTPIRIKGGGKPVVVSYKNDGDHKIDPHICGSEIRLSLLSDNVFNGLNAQDEREWRVTLMLGGVVQGRWFILPDDGVEPFATKPFPISVRGTDIVGTFKDVPYTSVGETFYKGESSQLSVLVFLLAKTDLDLNIVIADNTFEAEMDRGAAHDCPWEQALFSNARYFDEEGLPFASHDVLKSLLAMKSCKMYQISGKWYIINQEELNRELEPIPYREYTSAGVYVGNGVIDDVAIIGGNGRQSVITADNHTLRNAKAHKSDTTYYQYGYSSNQLINGSFDNWPLPMILPVGWTQVGGVVVGMNESKNTKGEPTGNYQLRIISGDNRQGRQYVKNEEGVQVRAEESVAISFDFAIEHGSMAEVNDETLFMDVMIFTDDGYAYTGSSWVKFQFGQTQEIKYKKGEIAFSDADYGYGHVSERRTVSINVPARDKDYKIFIGLGVAHRSVFLGTRKVDATLYDNVEIKPSVNDETLKPPLGRYVQHIQDKPLSYTPEPTLILNGDETNDQRTSWIRVAKGGIFQPDTYTSRWYRRGEVLPTPLLSIITGNNMQLHSRPYKIFEVSLVKLKIWPFTRANVDLLDNHYVFLSGEIDILNERSSLVLAEQVLGVAPVTEIVAEDYGNKKNKGGISIGAIGGIGTPSVPGSGSGGSGSGSGKPTNRFLEYFMVDTEDKVVHRVTTNMIDTLEFWSKTGELLMGLQEIDDTPPEVPMVWSLDENPNEKFTELNLHIRRVEDNAIIADYWASGGGIIGQGDNQQPIIAGTEYRAEVTYYGGATDPNTGQPIAAWNEPTIVRLEVFRNGVRVDFFEKEYETPPQQGSLGAVYFKPNSSTENWEVKATVELIVVEQPSGTFVIYNDTTGLTMTVTNSITSAVLSNEPLPVGQTDYTSLFNIANVDMNVQINNNSGKQVSARLNSNNPSYFPNGGAGGFVVTKNESNIGYVTSASFIITNEDVNNAVLSISRQNPYEFGSIVKNFIVPIGSTDFTYAFATLPGENLSGQLNNGSGVAIDIVLDRTGSTTTISNGTTQGIGLFPNANNNRTIRKN